MVEKNDLETLFITIKDGYSKGDKLDATNYAKASWLEDSKQLVLEVNHNKISDVVKSLVLTGKQGVDRFLDISIKDENGNFTQVQEINISPTASATFKEQEAISSLTSFIGEEVLPMNVSYEEILGADFLTLTKDELLPYHLNQNKVGDVYKIVKESLIENNEVEIWGYNFNNDKIDLSEFTQNYGYNVLRDNDNIQIQISGDGEAYSIVLKGLEENYQFSEDLEAVLQNVVIQNTDKN